MKNSKKQIKYKKINKEITKKLINILIKKFNYIFKKYIININYIYLSNDFSYIKIYINFIYEKNYNKIFNIINTLQKNEYFIKKLIIKETNLKYIPKIYFKKDNFYTKKNYLFNLLNKINNEIK